VLTDAARFDWVLGARSGVARSGTLVLRAPQRVGRFTLTVTANGHSFPRSRLRQGAPVSVVAQLGGVVGCAGLALLMAGRRRELRIAVWSDGPWA